MDDKFTQLRGLIGKSMNASPKSWRLFFRKYGFQLIPNRPEKVIVELYKQYGDSILADVNSILTVGKMDAITGKEISDTLKTGASIIEAWTKKQPEVEVETGETTVNINTETDAEKEAKRTKIIVVVFSCLCVVSIVTFVLINKFRK